MDIKLNQRIDEMYKKLFETPKCEWIEEGDKVFNEEEIKEMLSMFEEFLSSLDESGKSQFAGKLIGLGVLKKDEKTGKLVKGDKKMSTQQAIDKLSSK